MINKNYKVFIRNLSNSVVKSELYEIFSQYGVISGINVLNIFKQIERDTAEIFYIRKDCAFKAAEYANGLEINGKSIKATFYDEDSNIKIKETKNDIIIQINTTKKEPIWNRIKLANNN